MVRASRAVLALLAALVESLLLPNEVLPQQAAGLLDRGDLPAGKGGRLDHHPAPVAGLHALAASQQHLVADRGLRALLPEGQQGADVVAVDVDAAPLAVAVDDEAELVVLAGLALLVKVVQALAPVGAPDVLCKVD